jgi:hypothetical protein
MSKTHGHSNSPTYRSWRKMLARCRQYAQGEAAIEEVLGKLGNAAVDGAALVGRPGPAAKDYGKRLATGRLLPGLSPRKEPHRN